MPSPPPRGPSGSPGGAGDRTVPDPGRRRGLASADPVALGDRILAAWDAFADLAEAADLAAGSRLPGWRGRDVVAHLGRWDDREALADILASARSGSRGPVPAADAVNAATVAAHVDASDAEVVAAVRRSRDALAEFFGSDLVAELGQLPAQSIIGPLPVLTLVHAGCYELAVHALDLAPCRAPAPPAHLLSSGLAALVDATGALAADRMRAAFAAQSPNGGWVARSDPTTGWETHPLPPGPTSGPAILGTAAALLDVSAGRASAVGLLVNRRLRVRDMPGLLRLAPILEQVPGLPGGPALKIAVRALSGVGGLVGRLPRLPRRFG